MKSLSEVVNAQTESFLGSHFTDMNVFNTRVYHLDNNCIWRNSDLHIPVSEITRMDSKDWIVFPTIREFYKILVIDRLAGQEDIATLDKLQDFLRKLDKLCGLRSVFNVAEDFNYEIVYNSAFHRARYRSDYVRKYGFGNQYEVHPNNYSSMQRQRIVDEVSVERHRKFYESKKLTVEGVAYYLEITVSRARALSHCPGFPISESGRPKSVSVIALNSWLSENPELFLVSTGSLVEYMEEKVTRKNRFK